VIVVFFQIVIFFLRKNKSDIRLRLCIFYLSTLVHRQTLSDLAFHSFDVVFNPRVGGLVTQMPLLNDFLFPPASKILIHRD